MAFSQTTITNVSPRSISTGMVFLRWQSSSPAGTWFQVYLAEVLSWWGQSTSIWLPVPRRYGPRRHRDRRRRRGADRLFVVALLGAERRASIAWLGGTYEDDDIAGFHVYGPDAAGDPVDYSKVLATVPAYPAVDLHRRIRVRRFRLWRFRVRPSSYSWVTPLLGGGTWTFGVKPFDVAGNEGSAMTASVLDLRAPNEPAPFADRTRLHYTYSASTHEVTLNWNPSPA